MPTQQRTEKEVSERIEAFYRDTKPVYDTAMAALQNLGSKHDGVVDGVRELFALDPKQPGNLNLDRDYDQLVTSKFTGATNPALARSAQNGITPEFAAEIASQLTHPELLDKIKDPAGQQHVQELAAVISGETIPVFLKTWVRFRTAHPLPKA